MTEKAYKPKYIKKILVSHEETGLAIKKAAKWASDKFRKASLKHEYPIFIALLRGAAPFHSKLIMNMDIDVIPEYMVVSSYCGTLTAQSKPKIKTNIVADVKGKDVVICDDVADTARTLKLLKKYFKQQGARSVTCMVLVDKPAGRLVKFEPDYACFKMKGKPFLVGYGLDVKEVARNVPFLAEFDKKYIDKI